MMQRFSSYQESSTNISNINGKQDIKQSAIDYYKENNNPGKGKIRLRDNNLQEKILFNENNMNNVVDYLKNKKKKQTSLENRLNSFLTRKKKRKKRIVKGTKGTAKVNKKKKGTAKVNKKKKGTAKVNKKKKGTAKRKAKRTEKKKK